eukprot:1213039-Prymnesium_polylepis.2
MTEPAARGSSRAECAIEVRASLEDGHGAAGRSGPRRPRLNWTTRKGVACSHPWGTGDPPRGPSEPVRGTKSGVYRYPKSE